MKLDVDTLGCPLNGRGSPGAAENPDLIITGTPQLVVGVLTGQLSLTAARARGLRTRGNAKILTRLHWAGWGGLRAVLRVRPR